MELLIKGKFLFVENIGRSISPNQIYSAAIFHCLINDCEYQTKNVPDFIDHLRVHAETKWSGFCNTCDSAIHNEEVDLLYELCHFSKTHDKDIQLLPDDKLRMLQNVLIDARKQRQNKKPAPTPSTQTESSTSASVQSTKNRVQIDEEQSSLDQTSTTDRTDVTLGVSHAQFSSSPNNTSSEQSLSVVYVVQQSEVNTCSEETTAGDKACSVHAIQTQTIVPNAATVTSDKGDKVDVEKTTARSRKRRREGDNKKTTARSPKRKRDTSEVTNKTEQLSEIFHCKCYYCGKIKTNPIDIYSHWKTECKDNPRFMFKIVKVFKCPHRHQHCRHCLPYQDLKTHIERNHKGELFGMIDNNKPNQCGLCFATIENENTSHFRDVHPAHTIDTELEIDRFLTNELLDRLTGRCTHCDQFFTVTELPTHTKHYHPDIAMNDSITYGCFKCPHHTDSDEKYVVERIREHLKKLECKICHKELGSLDMIKVHHMARHKSDEESFGFVDVDSDKYALMEIIFPNGLVLTKRDCQKTTYGDMTENVKTVMQKDEEEMAEIMKGHQEKPKNESTSKPSENKKKGKNANQGRNVKRKVSRNVTHKIEFTSKPPESNRKRKVEDANEARDVKGKEQRKKKREM